MDKIKITKVIQGTTKLNDGTYAIGLKTKWGTAWLTNSNIFRFLSSNPHLKSAFMQNFVYEADLVGRYIWVAKKQQQWADTNGNLLFTVKLF